VLSQPFPNPIVEGLSVIRPELPEFALKMLEESFGDFAISDKGLSRTVAISY
jgi:hypothetical protein